MTNARIGTLGYNALDIAEYIIKHENYLGHCMSNLKLQKVLYFLQAQFLVTYNKSLFDEDLIAWDFGPIVKSVYYNYRMFGSASIFVSSRDCRNVCVARGHRELIDQVLDLVRPYTSTDSLNFCHNQRPFKHARLKWDNVISLEELRDYFKEE